MYNLDEKAPLEKWMLPNYQNILHHDSENLIKRQFKINDLNRELINELREHCAHFLL